MLKIPRVSNEAKSLFKSNSSFRGQLLEIFDDYSHISSQSFQLFVNYTLSFHDIILAKSRAIDDDGVQKVAVITWVYNNHTA